MADLLAMRASTNARRLLSTLVGSTGACALMSLAGASQTVHAASAASLDSTSADWRQKPRAVLWPKVSSIIGKLVFDPQPQIPAWEQDLQATNGLRRRDEMSRMAKSSSDGCLMVHPPRIYVHEAVQAPNVRDGADTAPAPAALSDKQSTYAVWQFGDDAVGHPGVVHGGAISMAIDESCGFAFFALNRGLGFTAYLHVNYRAPLPAGTPILVTVRPKKIDGRKVTLEATVTDGSQKVFADGEALFVQPRGSQVPSSKL